MPITINGSGTIAGITPGGLEDGCVNSGDLATAAVTNAKLAANAVTIDKMGNNEQSQLCKAWVNFNGTGTVAIRASYNVSSITDNGTGTYTVNFTNALADANYSIVYGAAHDGFSDGVVWSGFATYATSGVQVFTGNASTGALADLKVVNVAIFR